MKKLTTLLVAMLFTAGMAFAQSNDATIDQVGDDHESTITQVGSLNGAYVEQTADAGREGADVGTATIEQTGSENSVNLRQRAFYGDAEADIVQLGDRNRVEGAAPGNDFLQNHGLNIIDVYMDGDDNVLYSLRSESQKNTNELYLDILGNDNSVGMEQETGYGDISIDGNLNTVTLSQLGNNSAYNTAMVDILGNENGVSVTQTMDSNTAAVNVNGSFNSATVTQN
jgi:hypothetical protein